MNDPIFEYQFFVYQAYGKIEILQQTVFSVISLLASLKEPSAAQILIYTDQESYFRKFFEDHPQIHYEPLSQEVIQKWRGEIQFVHRLKIEMLLHAEAKYKGKFIYLDGDTYFLSSPMPLFRKIDVGHTLMHLPEGKISALRDPLSRKIKRFLRREQFDLEGTRYMISPDLIMWNAGVIGYASSHQGLLKKILHLTDLTYKKYQKHVMEQLSVSEVLQKATTVQRTDDVIYHYWNQKEEYQALIQNFLESATNIKEFLQKYKDVQFPAPPKPKKALWDRMKTLFSETILH